MEDLISLLPAGDTLIALAVTYGGKLLLAILILLIGLWLIRRFSRVLKRLFEMRSFEQTLQSFLTNLIVITLKILLLITVISMIGVQMTSFIAILGAAGLAVGLALSGTMQNFAGGVILLIFKPFKVGDFIEAQGYMGTVKEIQIFHTVLNTPDKKTVIIPNGGLSTGALTNFSSEPVRRVEWTFGISYSDNIDKARAIILDVLESDERIHADPAPFVGLISLSDSSVDLVTRVWVNTPDFWNVFFDINEKVKKEFDNKGVSIPFPQRDVHLYQK